MKHFLFFFSGDVKEHFCSKQHHHWSGENVLSVNATFNRGWQQGDLEKGRNVKQIFFTRSNMRCEEISLHLWRKMSRSPPPPPSSSLKTLKTVVTDTSRFL